MKLQFCIWVVLLNVLFIKSNGLAQKNTTQIYRDSTYYGIDKPNVLSTHPLGEFISRIDHNFKVRSDRKINLYFGEYNGNVFSPLTTAYFPYSQSVRNFLSTKSWNDRVYWFATYRYPSSSESFIAEGVIRSYQFKLDIPFGPTQELSLSPRMFSLDRGNSPYSFITNDATIEWFHSNIAGGYDPFGRRFYGYHHAIIQYIDQSGKTLTVSPGQFVFSGFEADYSYYPICKRLNKRNYYFNLMAHSGINTTKFNPTIDAGTTIAFIKKIEFKRNRVLSIGASAAVLRQGLIQYAIADRVNFATSNYFYSLSGHAEYKKYLKRNRSISYGLNYFFQTSYDNLQPFSYLVMMGVMHSKFWPFSIRTLYRHLEGTTFVFGYTTHSIYYFAYIREDLLVDNMPDIQTGFGFKINLK